MLIPIGLQSNRQERMRRRFGLACYEGQSSRSLPEPTVHTTPARGVWFVAARGISSCGAVCSRVALQGPRIARVDASLEICGSRVICGELFSPSCTNLIISNPILVPSCQFAPQRTMPNLYEESFDWLIGQTLPGNLAWIREISWNMEEHWWKSIQGEPQMRNTPDM